jgi:hypothetical protein
VTLSVLGDPTGNDGNEWVAIWAQAMAKSRIVTIHLWDDKAQQWMPKTAQHGSSGARTDIWKFSSSGRSASYPSELMDAAQPLEPDFVIYNFRHNN